MTTAEVSGREGSESGPTLTERALGSEGVRRFDAMADAIDSRAQTLLNDDHHFRLDVLAKLDAIERSLAQITAMVRTAPLRAAGAPRTCRCQMTGALGVEPCECQGSEVDCLTCAGTNRSLVSRPGSAAASQHVPCPTHRPDAYRRWVASGAHTGS